ncbi:MAG: S-layer homology domain-containing protein [Oscillospiraceae bacterium]|nr:S-layer homology domain-containing protein [Oscillospiraceae bacterium]
MHRKKTISILVCLSLIFPLLSINALAASKTIVVPSGTTDFKTEVVLTTRGGPVAGVQFAIQCSEGLEFVGFEMADSVKSASMTPTVEKDEKTYIGFYSSNNDFVLGLDNNLVIGDFLLKYTGSNTETIVVSEVKLVRVIDKDTTNEVYEDSITYTFLRQAPTPTKPTPLPSGQVPSASNSGTVDYWTYGNGPTPVQIGDLDVPLGDLYGDKKGFPPFINGFPDGTVQPDSIVTREQYAQIIYNLYAGGKTGMAANYSDVNDSSWSYNAVAFCQENDYMIGYPDGSFMPGQALTRAELSTSVARIKGLKMNPDHPFTDVGDHWGGEYIGAMYAAGYISGYPDGTFAPDNFITRAETVTILCRSEGRDYNLFDTGKTFSDLDESHWAYRYVMHAANGYSN